MLKLMMQTGSCSPSAEMACELCGELLVRGVVVQLMLEALWVAVVMLVPFRLVVQNGQLPTAGGAAPRMLSLVVVDQLPTAGGAVVEWAPVVVL